MHRFTRIAVGAIAVMALSACGGGGAATGGTASQPAAGAPCATSTASGTVAAGIKDFAFDPATVSAKVGDVITWTNNGAVGHTATVDGQSACDTKTIGAGKTGSLTFSVAGTYAIKCTIHASMKGSITISG